MSCDSLYHDPDFYYLYVLKLRVAHVISFFFQIEQNPFVGFIAIAIAVLCSGFAGKITAGLCGKDL